MSYRKERLTAQKKHFKKNFCEECLTYHRLGWQIHHIIYKSEAGRHENIDHPKNLLIVCADCHQKLHNNKKKHQARRVHKRQLRDLFPDVLHNKYK